MQPVWRGIDLTLRFVYVLVAPVFLVAFAAIIPMTGVLVGVGLATVVALVGSEAWRARTARIPLVGGFLGRLANLGDYYREHPPKPLVYYVVYPLLAPYWLVARDARREFLLYRKLNTLALLLIPALGAVEYYRKWRPEIPVSVFLTQTIASFVLQLLVTFALVMPIVTTIVAFHHRGKRKLLAALLVVAALAAVAMTLHVRRRGEPDHFTAIRMSYRAQAEPRAAAKLLAAAVAAADRALRADPADRDAALAAMRGELEKLWRADEAALFQLDRGADGTTLVHVSFRRKPTIWLARLPDGRFTFDPAAVAPDVRAKLRRPRVPTGPATSPPASPPVPARSSASRG